MTPAASPFAPPLAPRGFAPRARPVVRNVLAIGVPALLLTALLPRVAGAGWTTMGATLLTVSPALLLLLAVVWFAGLLAHMLVLTSALPGLTVCQGLLLSLTGSAVSNVLPAGGAAGTALNYTMVRGWGHSRAAFILFCAASHLWGLVVRLGLPAIALLVLLATSGTVGHLVLPAAVGTGALLALGAAGWALLTHENAALRVARAAAVALSAVARAAGRGWRPDLEAPARDLRCQLVRMACQRWRRPMLGQITYFTLQAALLWGCLHVVGTGVGLVAVFAVYAVERLVTTVVLTPGGLGVAEVTMAAMLAAVGAAAPAAAAGVLLYRTFTYALEIPVGGALLLGWIGRNRLRRRIEPVPLAETPAASIPTAGVVAAVAA